MSYKTRPDEDDGFGQIIPLCREHTLSRVNPQSRPSAAILGRTIIGPVIEVQIVKILDQYGHEIAIPSPNDTKRTSCGMISRRNSRCVDEFHIPNAELRSSAELLSESTRRRILLGTFEDQHPGDWCGPCYKTSQTSIEEICADTLSISPSQASFFTQRTIPTTEMKWTVFPANSSYGGDLSVAVSETVTRKVRHYDQDERPSDAAVHWDAIKPVLLKAFAKQEARDFSDQHWLRLIYEGSSKTVFE